MDVFGESKQTAGENLAVENALAKFATAMSELDLARSATSAPVCMHAGIGGGFELVFPELW